MEILNANISVEISSANYQMSHLKSGRDGLDTTAYMFVGLFIRWQVI